MAFPDGPVRGQPETQQEDVAALADGDEIMKKIWSEGGTSSHEGSSRRANNPDTEGERSEGKQRAVDGVIILSATYIVAIETGGGQEYIVQLIKDKKYPNASEDRVSFNFFTEPPKEFDKEKMEKTIVSSMLNALKSLLEDAAGKDKGDD